MKTHGDTVFVVTYTYTTAPDSARRCVYAVPDSICRMVYFNRIVSTSVDSVQVNKMTTSSMPNTAGFITPTSLTPYASIARVVDSLQNVRQFLQNNFSRTNHDHDGVYQPAGSYPTGTGTANGTNTGDNAVNTLYSGLAASKQDALVSGTSIKTINGSTILGSGDLVVSGSGVSRTFLPNDVPNSNAVANTIADVTGLSFNVVANTTYSFRFFIVYTSAATTTGSRWSINGPAATFMHYSSEYTLTATSITNNQGLTGYNVPAGVSASSLATGNICIIEGIIRPSASGTVIARFSSEIAGSAITAIGSGRSYVEYQAIN